MRRAGEHALALAFTCSGFVGDEDFAQFPRDAEGLLFLELLLSRYREAAER